MNGRSRHRITRRAFVRLGGLTLAGGTLLGLGAACAPIQPAAPTAASGAAGKPAEAKPAATATPVGGAVPAATSGAAAAKPTTAPAAAPTTTPAAKPTQAAAAAAKTGGAVRYAHIGGFLNFDGHRFANTNHAMFNTVYNTLITLDKDMKPQPELAESWQFSDDNRSLTVKLRKGVKFHNGRELTSDDVKANLERVKDPKTAAHAGPLAAMVDQVDTPDAQTAILRLNRTAPNVFDLLDLMYIMAPESFAEVAQKAVGTGPFVLKEWKPQDQSTYSRNPDYFKSGLPKVDQLSIQVAGDSAALVLYLETAAVDIVERLPPQETERLKGAGVRVDQIWGGSVHDTLINTRKKPFDDKRVRQAMGMAINRDRAIAVALGGVGEAWCIPFPKASLAYNAETAARCKFDLNGAKQMLDRAGVSGLEFELLASTSTFPDSAQRAQLLQADLQQIGVKAQIRDIEAPDYRDRTWGDNYQVAIHAFGRANRDPDTLFRVARAWWPKNNFAGYESPEYTRLVDEAGSTLDAERRRALYKQLCDLIVDEAFMITVSPSIEQFGSRPQIQGLTFNLEGLPVYENITVS
ncbi:MAG: ABC transporter substrate-binding protein [Chloroflexi bacterium]|nr:ABC transporter substrate-binding protein [Chloroflexota bacterium]